MAPERGRASAATDTSPASPGAWLAFHCILGRDRLRPDHRGRSRMRRRQFIAGLGSAAAWPIVAQAQQRERMRRIGVLMPGNENDPGRQVRLAALTQTLANLGWADGRNNVRVDVRWGRGDINRIRGLAQELVGLQPEIIVTNATPETVAVASGLVATLDRPGGNVTGFAIYEPGMAGA
jgi:putative ABC transport system substrate-binding protein